MAGVGDPQITIRRAEENDIAKLTAVLAPGVSSEQIGHRWQEYHKGYREMLVAELNGEVAGTVSTSGYRFQIPDSLRMFALDVGPAYRRQGVGTALIRATEKKARREGLGKVNLEVALDNDGAIRLYESLGYYRLGAPVTDQWIQITDNGSHEQVEEYSWIMVRDL